MMTPRIIAILLLSTVQLSCCSQSFSYPVIVDVTKIEVTASSSGQVINDISDHSRINQVIRFIDERRSRWCSPRFVSLPDARVTLFLQIRGNGRGKIGFGDGFFVAEFADGRYQMDISDNEVHDFLSLIGANEEWLNK
jgi:hypothetical protein